MSTKTLAIDWTRCDGHGLCARIFPERITLDAWGFPLIDGGALRDEETSPARLAVRSCPRLALRLEPVRTANGSSNDSSTGSATGTGRG